jgi:hypothetical protein
MGWKNALFFVLLMIAGRTVFAQHAADRTLMELTGVDATDFPDVRVQFRALPQLERPVMRLAQEQIMVREGQIKAGIVSLKQIDEDRPLFIALVIDRSSYASGHPFGTAADRPVLDEVKVAVNHLFDLVRSGKDSVMLVGYSGEVDLITDFNHELGVFSLIIDELEPGGGAAFLDGVQVAMEALSVHEGIKQVIAITHGPDTHSRQASAEQVAAYAQAQGIVLHVLTTTESERVVYETLGDETGGSCQVVRSGQEMSGYLTALFRSMREQYELTFRSPDAATGAVLRPFLLDVWQESQIVMQAHAAYRPGEAGIYPAAESAGGKWPLAYWIGGALAMVLVSGVLYALAMYYRDRAVAAPVIPVILELSYDMKRDRLKVKYNVPNRSQPVKFTIYSESGAPVVDAVLSGKKTQALVNISAIPNGQYVCDISNAGITSETRKMTWHNP